MPIFRICELLQKVYIHIKLGTFFWKQCMKIESIHDNVTYILFAHIKYLCRILITITCTWNPTSTASYKNISATDNLQTHSRFCLWDVGLQWNVTIKTATTAWTLNTGLYSIKHQLNIKYVHYVPFIQFTKSSAFDILNYFIDVIKGNCTHKGFPSVIE
jgi:hypothetical protein